VEKTRAKEAREAKKYEANKEANRVKVEANRVEVEAKEEAKKRAKEAKARKKAEQEEHRAAMALAALEIPKSTGAGWNRKNCKWEVQFVFNGKKNRHLGCFDFDDHMQKPKKSLPPPPSNHQKFVHPRTSAKNRTSTSVHPFCSWGAVTTRRPLRSTRDTRRSSIANK
jgi:hypothetical protein